MITDEKLSLIKQVGEEIVKEDELKKLLESDEQLTAYDGFEPSGQIHIAQGLLRAINVNKIVQAGIKFKILVADWHALANNKMGGDLEKIQTVGKYFIEVWRACGMDLKNVEFVWASDMAKNPDYWKLVVQVGKTNALKRFIRTAEMMGREESLEKLTGAHIIYSCMQVADIFTLGAKITQLGMDQRKLNMLAREIGPQLGFWKPVVVSHHMLMGLQKPSLGEVQGSQRELSGGSERDPDSAQLQGFATSTDGNETSDTIQFAQQATKQNEATIARVIALKMSKSHPDSAIFMTDTTEDVKRKINKAWCLEGEIKDNPVLEYCKYIIFEKVDKLAIERPEKFGGTLTLNSYQDLENKFAAKEIHPQDLKVSVASELDKLLQPVREHFIKNAEAKTLLEKVKSYQITR